MIRMCDTMQTWKWGGFGLGWRRWGERRGLPPDRQRSAVPRVCSPRSRPVSGAPAPHPSPLGSQSRGCDGGTAAGASPRVGTIGLRCFRHRGVQGLGGGAGRWIFCRALVAGL